MTLSKRAPADLVAFWVKASEKHLRENVAPVWGIQPPGVTLVDPKSYVPSADGALVQIVDDDGLPDAAGAHWWFEGQAIGVVDMGQSRMPSRTLDHEDSEIALNQMLNQWVEAPDGRLAAKEINDPCQRQSFGMDVSIMGRTETVVMSDFVTPAWFGLESGPTTYLDQEIRPFQTAWGGYVIWKDKQGRIEFEARGAVPTDWVRRRTSRTHRILMGLEGHQRV